MHTHTHTHTHTGVSDFAPLMLTIDVLSGTEGGSAVCFYITIVDDNIDEAEQSFSVILTSNTPDIFTVADDGALTTITIIDNEGNSYKVTVILRCEAWSHDTVFVFLHAFSGVILTTYSPLYGSTIHSPCVVYV